MSHTAESKGKGKRRRRSERNAAMFDDETVEFIQAIDAYRRRYDRSFPAWSEVLSILKSLGYRKVAEPSLDTEHIDASCEIAEPMEEVSPMEPDPR